MNGTFPDREGKIAWPNASLTSWKRGRVYEGESCSCVQTVAMARVSNVPRLSISECQASSFQVLDVASIFRCVSMSSPKKDIFVICAIFTTSYSSCQVERSLASQSDFAEGKGSAWNSSEVSQWMSVVTQTTRVTRNQRIAIL